MNLKLLALWMILSLSLQMANTGVAFGESLTERADLTITRIMFDPPYPMENHTNRITAYISNIGNGSASCDLEFRDEKNISEVWGWRYLTGYGSTSDDTFIYPGARRIRIFFENGISIGTYSYIEIYDGKGNLVERIDETNPSDTWSRWVEGDTIRVHAFVGSTSGYVAYWNTRYEAVIADENISLDANETMPITATWNATPLQIQNETLTIEVMRGKHNITVIADPDDAVEEIDEDNNELREGIHVKGALDFAVTDISFVPEDPLEGENVLVNATIRCTEGGADGKGNVAIEFRVDGIPFERKNVTINGTGYASAAWGAWTNFFNRGATHTITVELDPDNDIPECDEMNNSLSRAIEIELSSDLDLLNLTILPAHPEVGEEVNITAMVKNTGNRSENCTVWFYLGKNSSHYAPCASIGVINVLSPGASAIQVHIESANVSRYYPGDYLRVYDGEGRLVEEYSGRLEDLWTGWYEGENITIRWKRYDGITLGYRTPLTEKRISVLPGMVEDTTIRWKTERGEHTIWAEINNRTIGKDLITGGTDLTVDEILMEGEVWDSDALKITTRIANLGIKDADAFSVFFFNDSRAEPFHIQNITGLDANHSIIVNATWNARTWDGEKHSLNHKIRVLIDPGDNPESDLTNNEMMRSLTVNPSRDFYVENVTIPPLGVGEDAVFRITVKNQGVRGGLVDLGLFLDGYDLPLNNTTISIDADETEVVEIPWRVDAGGGHRLTVKADFDNRVFERDESNNELTEWIYINASDLAVDNLTVPSRVDAGDTIQINATIENRGDMGIYNANLAVYDCRKRSENGAYLSMFRGWYDPEWSMDGGVMEKDGAVAIRLYISSELHDNSTLRLYDKRGNLVISYNESFVGWTPWIWGDSIKGVLQKAEGHSWGGVGASTCEWLEGEEVWRGELNLSQGEVRNITCNITARAGVHLIGIALDPEDEIIEQHEVNNVEWREILVRGADLAADVSLVTDAIRHGEDVNITATIRNIGVFDASNFSLEILVDDFPLLSRDNLTLAPARSLNISVTWKAATGNHTVEVIADSDDAITETDEENNIAIREIWVDAADLNVSGISFTEPFDGDDVNITARIENQGVNRADNFSAIIFYEIEDLGEYNKADGTVGSGWIWINRSLEGAGCVILRIYYSRNIDGNVMVFDKEGVCVAAPSRDGWITVFGDEANVYFNKVSGVGIGMEFYAGNFTRYESLSLDANQSMNLSMIQPVSTGNHTVMVLVDPEERIPENDRENNYAESTMAVEPSRDFTVDEIIFIKNGRAIGANDTIEDGERVTISASVRNQGIRDGTCDFDIIYESEWINITPGWVLTPSGYALVIAHPGCDGIRIHLDELALGYGGCVEARDDDGHLLWSRCHGGASDLTTPWFDTDKIYIYRAERLGSGQDYPYGRINPVIDRYQYRFVNRSSLYLPVNTTGYINASWNVSWNPTVKVIADPDGVVGEIDETNNGMEKVLNLTPVRDPEVLDISFNPANPVEGNDVLISATIRNSGCENATFTVEMWAELIEDYTIESGHGDEFPKGYFEWEVNKSYQDADWIGAHFKRIDTAEPDHYRTLFVDDGEDRRIGYFTFFEGGDIWTWACDDKIRIKTMKDEFHHVGVYGFKIDRLGYRYILNRTNLTLPPNGSCNITGELYNLTLGNRTSSYKVYVSVDRDNILYEVNEENNEREKVLWVHGPDLTVSGIEYNGTDTVAKIENVGIGNASNVTVRFLRDREYFLERSGTSLEDYLIQEADAECMRVHVKELNVTEGYNGYLKVGDLEYDYDRRDFWSPWITGNCTRLDWSSAHFIIDRYEYGIDERLGNLSAGEVKGWAVPFDAVNEVYNLTVVCDPEDDISESDEGNNAKGIEMGPDISVKIPPNENDFYLLVNHSMNLLLTVRNEGNVPAEGFNITFSVDENPAVTFSDIALGPYEKEVLKLEWKPPYAKKYNFTIMADPEENIPELDEKNNNLSFASQAFDKLGYDGSELHPYKVNEEVRGEVIFRMGDRADMSDPLHWYEVCTYNYHTGKYEFKYTDSDRYQARWNITLPDDATIRVSRLYLYWGYSYRYNGTEDVPASPTINMKFNGNPVYPVKKYTDQPISGAVSYGKNYAYGTYCYDVNVQNGDNIASFGTSDISGVYKTLIAGMGLLVVYEGGNETYTRYWVDEGADVLLSGVSDHGETPLLPDECTTRVPFDGCVDFDRLGNATLITVVLWGDGGDEVVDEDFFNGTRWEGKMKNALYLGDDEVEDGVWVCNTGRDATGIDEREVRDLIGCNNNFGIQDRGDFMMAANAFLILTYPPDLTPEIAPPSNPAAGSTYTIPVTIHNLGRSKAKNFNVTFSTSDGYNATKTPGEIEPDTSRTVNFTWTPQTVGRCSLTVMVDSGFCVDELDETNNNATVDVTVIEPEPTQTPGLPGGHGGGGGGGSGIFDWGKFSGTGVSGAEGNGTGEFMVPINETKSVIEEGSSRVYGYPMGEEPAGSAGGGGKISYIWVFIVTLSLAFVLFGYWREHRFGRGGV